MNSARHWLARLSWMCAGVVVAAVAQAGNIRGSWDPQFNSYFTGVGFRGELTFFVPDTCLNNGPINDSVYLDDTFPCWTDDGGVRLIDAEVVLYGNSPPGNVLTTITFANPVPTPDPILGIRVQFGPVLGAWTVTGIDTDPIGPELSDPDSTGNLPVDFPEWLYLQLATGDSDSSPNFDDLPDAGAYLLPTTCSECEPSYSTAPVDPNARSDRAIVVFVPEPGSLALLLSAMGVGWLARRRRAAR